MQGPVDPGEEAMTDARSVSAHGRQTCGGRARQAEGLDGSHFAGNARTSTTTARGVVGC